MAQTSTHKLYLLADHLKLSLLERQRAITINIDSSKQDATIKRSLQELGQGIESLEGSEDLENAKDVTRLRSQYDALSAQFDGSYGPTAATQKPNDPTLASDFAAARSVPSPASRNKNVRFRDNPDEADDDVSRANRAALFSDQERYRDEPVAPDQSRMDNQQVHAYHKQVLRDQDEQLDVLGQSISRQRMLGIQIGDELQEHNMLLDDVESGVDRHTTTLDRARKRLGHVARKSKDNWNWVTIAILILILLLLIIVL